MSSDIATLAEQQMTLKEEAKSWQEELTFLAVDPPPPGSEGAKRSKKTLEVIAQYKIPGSIQYYDPGLYDRLFALQMEARMTLQQFHDREMMHRRQQSWLETK